MALAYLFALAVRYIWVDWASQVPEFFWNGQLMINTNDGYFWAEGARDILAGTHQPHDLSPIHEPIARLTAFLASVLPVKFETVILWMPAFFGSLIVVPIMLIARELKQDLAGFLAALLGGIAWSYYNRTMTGYYDTDMLTVVLPTFVLWGLVHAMLHRRNRWLLLLSALMLFYQWWYPSAVALDTAFAGMLFLYTLLFERKSLYHYKLLLFMTVTVTPIPLWLRLILLAGLFLYFHVAREKSDRVVLPLLGVAAVAFVLLGGLGPVWYQVKGYLLRESAVNETKEALQLHFYAVSKTVREAGQIPFELFANRISGAPATFLLSVVGYLLLAFRYRVMWLALPMVGLGFIAMQGGLRFTVYAVPVMALGLGYLLYWFAERVSETFVADPSKRRWVNRTLLGVLGMAVLYPNIRHVVEYKVPTVFRSSEVAILDRLHKIAGREDYVLSWWDYGYPIRYYADVKTLVDGGKHSGDVNYPVSFALTAPQAASAAMARLDVHYTEADFESNRSGSYLAQMMEDAGIRDPELFLRKLEKGEIALPKLKRQVYYYLPMRMMNIFPTVAIFSAVDLRTGTVNRQPFFHPLQALRQQGQKLEFAGGVSFDLGSGVLALGNRTLRAHSFLVSTFERDGKVRVQEQRYDEQSPYYLLYLKSLQRFILMDRKMFDSTYVQLYMLGHYDSRYFEPVIRSPWAAVYRLKTSK